MTQRTSIEIGKGEEEEEEEAEGEGTQTPKSIKLGNEGNGVGQHRI